MIKWNLVTKKLSDLKEHAKNPRRLTKEQEHHLRTSLEKFGLVDKLVVNLDGTIIGGHQRKKTLKKIGYKDVECLVPDRQLDDREVDELSIRLNKNSGTFDFDKLSNEWDSEDLLNWGFTLSELDGCFDIEEISSDDDDKRQEKKAKKCKMCPHCGKEL